MCSGDRTTKAEVAGDDSERAEQWPQRASTPTAWSARRQSQGRPEHRPDDAQAVTTCFHKDADGTNADSKGLAPPRPEPARPRVRPRNRTPGGRVQRRVLLGSRHPHSPDLSDLSHHAPRPPSLRIEYTTRCHHGFFVDPLDRLQLRLLNRSDVTASKRTPCGWPLPACRARTAGGSSPVVEPQHRVSSRRPGASDSPDPHGYRSMPSPLSHPTRAWRPTLGGPLPLGPPLAGWFRRSTVSQPPS